jgi:peptide methionine sulfoxide reductase msrA/msrB
MSRVKYLTMALAGAALMAAAPFAFASDNVKTAIFAGGCFWSMQAAFEEVYGVISAVSGYTGGRTINPTYNNYAENGHVEAVRVTFDPTRVGYSDLLDAYWRHTDPTDAGGQFVDRGPQYRPVIYWMDEGQKAAAEQSKAALEKSRRFPEPIVTEIAKAQPFYKAEEYHQDYPKKHPEAYALYHDGSGRDPFFARIWGASALKDPEAPPLANGGRYVKPSEAELRKTLTPMEFTVTQREGTEPAFDNEYWNNHREGIYVDIVSGEPLFSSTDKFDSGTGWPSFTRPLAPGNIVLKEDRGFGMVRTEVKSRYAGSHLGHLFDDGPQPTGLRYCMDSASLRFVPVADLQKEGYGEYLKLFKK